MRPPSWEDTVTPHVLLPRALHAWWGDQKDPHSSWLRPLTFEVATRCHKDWLQQPWTALQCLCFHSALKESLKESYKLSHPKSLHLCDEAGFVQVSMMPPRKMKVDSQHEQTSTSLCYVIHCYIIVQIHHTIHSMQVQEVRLPNLKFQAHDTNSFHSHKGDFTPLIHRYFLLAFLCTNRKVNSWHFRFSFRFTHGPK